MAKARQLLNKDISFLSIVTTILVIIVVICLLYPFSSRSFLTLVISFLFASLIMLIYMIIAWRRLNRVDRWSISLSIIGWMWLFYGVIHAHGLTISSFFS